MLIKRYQLNLLTSHNKKKIENKLHNTFISWRCITTFKKQGEIQWMKPFRNDIKVHLFILFPHFMSPLGNSVVTSIAKLAKIFHAVSLE